MYPKFIIAAPPQSTDGFLRMGMVFNHRDLIEGYEKVYGGGFYEIDDTNLTVTLHGSSCDFGRPLFRYLKRIPMEFRNYTFIFTPSPDLPGNPLDLSHIQWV